ncbi:MAG: hypothetical protein C0424_10435 [Sphingobacteriaceae bacterium]|nr:hypothetical protein [Sphingobacteriaceae bacterium]
MNEIHLKILEMIKTSPVTVGDVCVKLQTEYSDKQISDSMAFLINGGYVDHNRGLYASVTGHGEDYYQSLKSHKL